MSARGFLPWLVAATLGGTPLGRSAVAADPSAVPVEAQLLVVSTDPERFEPLRRALEARVPAATVLPYAPETMAVVGERNYTFVEVGRSSGAGIPVRVILRDGRLFERQVPATRGDEARSLATTLANMLDAIGEERLEASARDVALPSLAAEAEPEPAPEPEPASEAEPEPEPASDAAVPVASESDPSTAPPSPARRSIEIGPSLWGGALAGVGAGRGGYGALGLDLDLALRSGLVVAVGARFATVGSSRLRVLRLAASAGIGYLARAGAFEMLVLTWFVAEPWWVTAPDATSMPADEAGDEVGPALGGMVTLAPGFRIPLEHRGVAVRLGLRGDVGVSALLSGGRAQIDEVRGDGSRNTVAGIGGVEVSVGANAALWFALGRR